MNISVGFHFSVPERAAHYIMQVIVKSRLRVRGEPIYFFRDEQRTPHILYHIFSNAEIVERLGSEFDGLSAADTSGSRPRSVYLNRENLINPPRHWPDKKLYRRYVIIHELLHTLGAQHPQPPPIDSVRRRKADRPCRIMVPQSKAATVRRHGCRVNASLLDEEQMTLDREFNIP